MKRGFNFPAQRLTCPEGIPDLGLSGNYDCRIMGTLAVCNVCQFWIFGVNFVVFGAYLTQSRFSERTRPEVHTVTIGTFSTPSVMRRLRLWHIDWQATWNCTFA